MSRLFLWTLLGFSLLSTPVHAETNESLPDRVEQWMEHVVLLLTGPAWCTGVVIDDQGTVATAYHCVASGLRTEVRTRKGGYHVGKMIAADPKNDVALLSVPELGSSIPDRTLSSVVFPHPDGPMMATIEPWSIESDTS